VLESAARYPTRYATVTCVSLLAVAVIAELLTGGAARPSDDDHSYRTGYEPAPNLDLVRSVMTQHGVTSTLLCDTLLGGVRAGHLMLS
jgi:hypothetical protein